MTPEGRIVQGIREAVAGMGGVARKCEWSGRSGAPDLLVMVDGLHLWIEVKQPGARPTMLQVREHTIMRRYGGCTVAVAHSVAEAVAAIEQTRAQREPAGETRHG